MKKQTYRLECNKRSSLPIYKQKILTRFLLTTALLYAIFVIKADDSNWGNDLLEQYVKTKGTEIILFDAINIKQFWTDNSVWVQNDLINIALNKTNTSKWESGLLKIQLANVNVLQDCTIEVISRNGDPNFTVFNSQSKKISDSSPKDFLQYHIASSTIHLEETQDFSFRLQFQSRESDTLAIEKIVLSFSNNENYLSNPGILEISRNDVTPSRLTRLDEKMFVLMGKQSNIKSNKKILISNKSIKTSVKVKNIGESSTRVYIGYTLFAKDNTNLDAKNYPYNKDVNESLTVNLAKEGSNSIFVDSYPKWKKNSYIGLNAKDDLSDIPTNKLLDGRVVDVTKIDDNSTEITIDKPLKNSLEVGSKIRILGLSGSFFYTNVKDLKPGEEESFFSEVQLDNQLLQYIPKAFPRGTFFVQPIILSYSLNSNEENVVLISDYKISF